MQELSWKQKISVRKGYYKVILEILTCKNVLLHSGHPSVYRMSFVEISILPKFNLKAPLIWKDDDK